MWVKVQTTNMCNTTADVMVPILSVYQWHKKVYQVYQGKVRVRVMLAYQRTGLPMKTALAPRARALMTSVPLVMPPSTYTSTRPATARQISGSTYTEIRNNDCQCNEIILNMEDFE